MSTPGHIHEVYIDSTGMPERNAQTLETLDRALGALAIERKDSPVEAEAMIVLGGDGAFLHALRRHDFPDIPVTGINTGTLGFYMDTAPTKEGVSVMAERLAEGNYTTKALPLLEVPRSGGQTEYAVNDVVVARKGGQTFKASLKIGEGEFEHFVGDGFIFSTPQGSTSYNLSAGGPMLDEDVPAYVVTPSNPHRSHQYFSLTAPTVVAASTEALVTVKEADKRPFEVNVDDHTLADWPADETEVRVRVSPDKRLRIMRFDGHDYFAHVSAAFRGKQS